MPAKDRQLNDIKLNERQLQDSLRLEKLEAENRRIRALLGAGPKESAEMAVEKLWRSYRDLLDKVAHLSEDCQREAQKFGLGPDSAADENETTPAEAQAEWERDQEEKARRAKSKSKRRSQADSRNVIPEGVETERHKQRRQARETAGFTPEQVAERFGISLAYYESIEREGCVDYDMAERLCRLFDCSLNIYMGR